METNHSGLTLNFLDQGDRVYVREHYRYLRTNGWTRSGARNKSITLAVTLRRIPTKR
jgi:hypothetical protein